MGDNSMIRLRLFNAYIANDFAFQGATQYAGVFLSFEQAVEALEDAIGAISSYAPPVIAKASSTGLTDQLWIRHNVIGQEDEHGALKSGVIMEITTYVSNIDLQAAILNPVDIVAQEIIDDEQDN